MSSIRRLWNAFRRAHLDEDLRQEIETHLALIAERERAQGADAAAAHQRARASFGSPLGYRERAIDGVIATWLTDAARDARVAWRRLTRSPGFTLAAVATLALAIGANVAIFAVVERVVLAPLPYPESGALVELDHGAARINMAAGVAMTPGLYFHYGERSHTLEGIALYRPEERTLTGDGEPELIQIARATPSLAAVLRVQPAAGRWFGERDAVPGAPAVAVLSHRLWDRRYGRDPRVVGRQVLLGGTPTEIVGVMPASFGFPNPRIEAWTALQLTRSAGFGVFSFSGVARLRAGADVAAVRAELNGLIHDVPQAFPGDIVALSNSDEIKLTSVARTLQEATVGNVSRALWILLASVGIVLLVACANVANLFLVRSDARQREVAVRRALGAGQLGIARSFLTESLLLSTAGGATGLAIAWVAVHLLVAYGPASLPRLAEVRLDAVVVLFALVMSALTALAFGLIPLWHGPSLAALNEQGRGHTASRSRQRARHMLMGGQVALALVLLVASALMVRSFQQLRSVHPGFDATYALAFSIGLPDRDYGTRDAAMAAHQAIIDGLAVLPGVTMVSAGTCLPLAGPCSGNTLRVEGRTYPPGTIPPLAFFRAVAGGYFDTLGIRVVRGRGLDRGDVERREPVAVINQALSDTLFPRQDPIGQRVASNRPPPRPGVRADLTWLTVVGVVANTPTRALAEMPPPGQVYLPMSLASEGAEAQFGPAINVMSYVVRAGSSPAALLPAVRRAVDGVDAGLAIARAELLEQALDRASAQMAFTMALLAIAAGVALVLGVIGVYGVMSYVVSQRTAEIGVRLALGAEPASVAGMIVRQGGAVALTGVAIGLGVAFAGSRVIESLLYGVSPRDPLIFATTALVLMAVTLLACWLPARRAARLDPLAALRTE